MVLILHEKKFKKIYGKLNKNLRRKPIYQKKMNLNYFFLKDIF